MSNLNSKTLMVAAVVLVVLALLVMATPLLRTAGITGRTGFNRQFSNNGGFTPGSGFSGQGSTGQGNTGQSDTGSTSGGTNPNFTGRRSAGGASSLFRITFLNGLTGTIVYGIALLVSLLAALGMLMTKTWGKILGIIMAVIYAALALLSTLPILLSGFLTRAGGTLSLNIGLNVVHLVLAIAVILLALIPARQIAVPTTQAAPPAASA